MRIPVFHSYGKWYLSGVSTWTVNMVRGMQEGQFDQEVLFTGIPPQTHSELDELEVPYTFLDLPAKRSRQAEWRELKRFLESRAPCIYIPNFDFHRSSAVGKLSPEVKVCGVIHSDEECYYDELRRVGSNFNAIVAVSSTIARKIAERFPHLGDRVEHIPYGIPIPKTSPDVRPKEGRIQLAYCNRLQQYQKRIFDLPPVLAELRRLNLDFHLTVAGDGKDAGELRDQFAQAGVSDAVTMLGRVSNEQVLAICRRAHFFLLTSDFEGLPISLLEAMAVGCVPVVYGIESGINDVLTGPLEPVQVPHGDSRAFARKLAELWRATETRVELSREAQSAVREKASLQVMCRRYEEVFQKIRGSRVRRTNTLVKPKEITFSFRLKRRISRIFIAPSLFQVGNRCEHVNSA